jgi:DNA-binding response OmpR family regulator
VVCLVLTYAYMLSGVRVLVADDDRLLLDSVAAALADLGADVVGASNGAELIDQLASRGPFDLVITDVGMPWMSGLTAMRAARTAGLDLSVIVMTGLPDRQIPAQVRSLGPDVVLLRKPFDVSELDAVASRLLGRRRQTSVGRTDR